MYGPRGWGPPGAGALTLARDWTRTLGSLQRLYIYLLTHVSIFQRTNMCYVDEEFVKGRILELKTSGITENPASRAPYISTFPRDFIL
jgi:hypothetical protein